MLRRRSEKQGLLLLLMAAAVALAVIMSLIALLVSIKAAEALMKAAAVPSATELTAKAEWAEGVVKAGGSLPGDDTPAVERCYLTDEERAALPQFETGTLEAVTVTYYCNEKYRHICGGGRGIAADGTPAEAWLTCAVDPSVIPLGSTVTVYLDGAEPLLLRANDTGGAVKGSRIDICVGSHQEALQLGRKTASVTWVTERKER